MLKKSLLLMLLMAVFMPWAANAQQALPYSYGFENNDLAGEGWTAQITSSSSGIYNAGSSTAYEGSYLFRFNYSETAGYLVSPLLTGTDAGVDMTFQYKEYSSTYGDEQFYVGYTTDETVTDPTAFTYGSIQTASLSWQEYSASLPAGTKRIAIQYVYNDAFYLYLDAFTFEAPGAVPKPTDLAVSGITAYGATLAWTENGTATSWQICVNDDETNLIAATTNPYQLTGLTPETAYSVKVRSVVGSESSAWSSGVSFTTADVCPDGLICIGTGNTTSIYLPTYIYYKNSLTQQIYTADELGASGSILSVAFYCTADNTYERSFDIYMQATDKAAFESATDWFTVTANDLVYSGSVTLKEGWNTFELDNPFDYDGRSNVALIIDANASSYQNGPAFYVFNANGNQTLRVYSDGTDYDPTAPSSYTGNLMTVKNRLRVEIGVPPTCPKPKNLAVSDVTNHTATLSWTAGGEEAAWTVQYGTDETFAGASSVNATATTKELTGLAAETVYYARVKANCGAGDESVWTDAISFETEIACAAPTNLAVSDVEPFSATVSWNGTAENYNLRYRVPAGFNYGFETAEGFVVDEFPPCTTYDGDGLPTYGISGYTMPNNTANYVGSVVSFNEYWDAHSGNLMGAFMDAIPDTDAGITANDDYFITPELTIAAGDHFIFWARSVTDSYGLERMKVGIYGGNGTITDYLEGSATSYVEVPVDWTEYDYDLTAYVGQTIQLAINCVSADAFALLFDDLFVGDPTNDSWDVTLNNVTSPYALTGLTDETTYELQVQAACGGTDGVSEWVGTSFMTPSSCTKPSSLNATNITPYTATLEWAGYQNSYQVQYRTAADRETYYFNDFNDENTEGWTRDYFIYGFTDPIYNVGGDDNYFLEMGWNSTAEETIISCELPTYPRGAYVEFYYFGYQTANTFQVGYSTTTNDADAFTWEDPIDAPLSTYTQYRKTLDLGIKYVAMKATASAQEAAVFIDNFGIFGDDIEAGAWVTATADATATLDITGLADGTKYEWQVRGVNSSCDGGYTEWSNLANFETPDACQVPVIDDVINIEARTATVNWTGVQEYYNVRYGEYVQSAMYDFDDNLIPTDWVMDTLYAWALTDTLTDAGYCIRSTNQGVGSSSSTISFTATYANAGVISFDAMFMGEGTSTYWDKCIFSIDGSQMFEYGAIGQNWYNMAYSFSAGEHTFTWSYTKDGSVDPTGDFFAIDNIKIQLQNSTWITVEGITGNSYDMTGLTPETVVAVQVQGVNANCDSGATSWSSEYLFITDKLTTVTQTLTLASGVNWCSFFVETNLTDLENALKAAFPSITNTQTLQIQSQTENVKYTRGRWMGELASLDFAQTYMITVPSACEITVEGMLLDPAAYTITLNPGTSWIGYPVNATLTVEEAFASASPINNDIVQSQEFNTKRSRGRWMGELATLQAGQGFMYQSVATTTKSFTFPTSTSKAAPKAKAARMSTLTSNEAKETAKFINKFVKSAD